MWELYFDASEVSSVWRALSAILWCHRMGGMGSMFCNVRARNKGISIIFYFHYHLYFSFKLYPVQAVVMLILGNYLLQHFIYYKGRSLPGLSKGVWILSTQIWWKDRALNACVLKFPRRDTGSLERNPATRGAVITCSALTCARTDHVLSLTGLLLR